RNGHADRQTGAARDRASDASNPIAARSVPHRSGAARRRYGCDKRASKRVRRWGRKRGDNAWIAGFCQETPRPLPVTAAPARLLLTGSVAGLAIVRPSTARCARAQDEQSSSMPSAVHLILSKRRGEATARVE